MKRLILLSLFAASLFAQNRYNLLITVTAGTPIQVTAGLACPNCPLLVDRTLIQMVHGGTGIGYVMDLSQYFISGSLPASVTPNHATAGQLTAELAPASATAPGGSYSDSVTGSPGGGAIDLSHIWLDGSHTGDTIIVTYKLRN